jgi:polyferredoxin
MDKIKQPKGLIRYASHKELYQGLKAVPLYKRYRVALYGMILLVCLAGVLYGFMNFSATEFTVTPQRQPVFTLMSNGEIQNKYTLKLLNKTNFPIHIKYEVKGTENYSIYGLEDTYDIAPGKAISAFALVRLSATNTGNQLPLKLQFIARSVDSGEIVNHYDTLFFTP